jgi:hypothetical protein
MRQRGRGWLDAAFDHDFEGALECELDFARCFLTGRSVSHDAGPFNDLGDEAFVPFSAEYQMRIS